MGMFCVHVKFEVGLVPESETYWSREYSLFPATIPLSGGARDHPFAVAGSVNVLEPHVTVVEPTGG
jgi:hypothetical protein